MAESLGYHPQDLTKAERYRAAQSLLVSLQPQSTDDAWACWAYLANVSAVLGETFGWWWVGFYLDTGVELSLGPFQGPLACTTIAYERGVCGAAYSQQKTQLVPDVHLFPGHIACSSATQSELVVPIMYEGQCLGVIDADSEWPAHYDAADAEGLEQIAALVAPYVYLIQNN